MSYQIFLKNHKVLSWFYRWYLAMYILVFTSKVEKVCSSWVMKALSKLTRPFTVYVVCKIMFHIKELHNRGCYYVRQHANSVHKSNNSEGFPQLISSLGQLLANLSRKSDFGFDVETSHTKKCRYRKYVKHCRENEIFSSKAIGTVK